MGEERILYNVLVGKLEGKRLLGGPKRRWEDGISIDVREIGWGVEWIQLAQDRDRWRVPVNMVINHRVSSVVSSCGSKVVMVGVTVVT
jgi:hypothetical protein